MNGGLKVKNSKNSWMLGGIFVLIGVAVIAFGAAGAIGGYYKRQGTTETTARLVSDSDDSLVFSYNIDGVDYRVSPDPNLFGEMLGMSVGDAAKLHVKSDNPRRIEAVGEVKMSSTLLPILIGLFLTGAGVFCTIVLRRKAKRIDNLLQNGARINAKITKIRSTSPNAQEEVDGVRKTYLLTLQWTSPTDGRTLVTKQVRAPYNIGLIQDRLKDSTLPVYIDRGNPDDYYIELESIASSPRVDVDTKRPKMDVHAVEPVATTTKVVFIVIIVLLSITPILTLLSDAYTTRGQETPVSVTITEISAALDGSPMAIGEYQLNGVGYRWSGSMQDGEYEVGEVKTMYYHPNYPTGVLRRENASDEKPSAADFMFFPIIVGALILIFAAKLIRRNSTINWLKQTGEILNVTIKRTYYKPSEEGDTSHYYAIVLDWVDTQSGAVAHFWRGHIKYDPQPTIDRYGITTLPVYFDRSTGKYFVSIECIEHPQQDSAPIAS